MANKKDIPDRLASELNAASRKLDRRLRRSPIEPGDGQLKIIHSDCGPESPFEGPPAGKRGIGASSVDSHGAFSLEKFATASSLRYTHDDAGGWLAYLDKFRSRNFWFGDQNVKIWAYYEQYDNWKDTYGMDAVLAVYHSGHGGMGGDGRFYVPLGADWGGQGTTACSDQMRLGNEQVRYIFWSTCVSLRVLGGHSPIRTWGPANLGFRMLFGYETVSYDDPDYGSGFWKHWRKGKPLSTAFLDASWYEVSHRQSPSVVACGATADEAKNRLYNERYMSWNAVSHNWWWWRWYNAATSATTSRLLNQKLPKNILIAELAPRVVDGNFVKQTLAHHNLGIGLPREIQTGPDGTFHVGNGDMRAAFESDGSYDIKFAQPNRENKSQISPLKAVKIAEDFVQYHGLDSDDLVFDRVLLGQEGGGSEKGSGTLEGPYVTETTIQFAQKINDLPVLLPNKGCLSVTVDNDGNVTNMKNSVRPIDRLTERLKNFTEAPEEGMPVASAAEPEMALGEAWQERMKEFLFRGRMPIQFTVVPGSYEIGYSIRGNEAVLVARKDIEVDCGNGYLKRYAMEVPIYE